MEGFLVDDELFDGGKKVIIKEGGTLESVISINHIQIIEDKPPTN